MKLYRQGMAVDYHLASHEDIIAAFNDLPLPVRLLALADTADAANARLVDEGATPGLATGAYRRLGSRWEREDAERAKEAAEVEEAAKTIYADLVDVWTDELPSDLALRLAKLGYRKQADDD